MILVTTRYMSGGLHEKHVVATWNLGNHLSICFKAQGNQEKSVKAGGRKPRKQITWPSKLGLCEGPANHQWKIFLS